jgi:predicted ATPase/DNA-binding CsgD family transcriptional regulator
LHQKRALLLLDNFEHLLDAAPLVTDLLATCSDLTVMVTSRAILRLHGERVYAVPTLAVPDLAHLPPVENLAATPAVRLFVERARAIRNDFALTAENASVVAQVCHRLDGLPLAIELAAARSSLLSPAAILTRLDRQLSLLTGGARDAPARLRTMRDAVAWSYDLLADDERALFRRLSVFVDGFTLEAAEAVCQGTGNREQGTGRESTPVPSVLDGIASLVEKSLLRRDGERFGILETIREYGLERLGESGEAEAIRQCHASFYLALVEEAEPKLRGAEQIDWIERLEAAAPNLRVALAWLRDSRDAARGLRLAGALWTFWVVRDHLPEGQDWLETFLDRGPAGSAERLKALTALGDMAERRGTYAAATAWLDEALALARGRGDRAGQAVALRILGNLSISLAAAAIYDRGDAARADEECARAERFLERSLALARELGDEWGAAKALHWLNNLPGRWNAEDASGRYDEAVATFRRLGDRWQLSTVLGSLGVWALDTGDLPRARAAFVESLELAQRLGHRWHGGVCVAGLAAIAVQRGNAEPAARMLAAAAALREAAGPPLRACDQDWHDRATAASRAAIGETAFAAAWAAGAALPADAAIAEALAWAAETTAFPATTRATTHGGLTPREVEVLRLIAEGKADKEIAAALAVSRRTAATHVAHILAKLDLPSRAGAASYAIRHGLA